jgi:hypothetical protein
MKPIADNRVIQIEVTNGCVLSCSNCTRHVGHHRRPFMMSAEKVAEAIASLEGFPGQIGLMGGEPAMHPQFREIMELYREMIPDRRRRSFWTTGWKWMTYCEDIAETFDPDLVHYNDHTQTTGKHQPLLIASEDVIPDAALREELIDDCWIQRQWSASITPKGAFFCEVAASLDYLFDGPGGWPVEPGWWQRIPDDYAEQRAFACGKCSAAIPMETLSDARGGRDSAKNFDIVSPSSLARLKAVGSPKIARGQYKVFDQQLTRADIEKTKDGWTPSHFRDFVAHSPEDVAAALDNAAD